MWRDVREVTKVDCVRIYIEIYGIYIPELHKVK